MRRNTRYILYFILGVIIYYAVDGDQNPEDLRDIHQIAPIAIMIVFVLLLFVRNIRKKKEEE